MVFIFKKAVLVYLEPNHKLAIEFLKLYTYDLGDFFSIIPHILLKRGIKMAHTKDKPEINSHTESKKEYIYTNPAIYLNKHDGTRKIILYTIIDFFAQISTVIYFVIVEDQNSKVKQVNLNSSFIFSIFSIILFSRLILKTETHFYKHHILSFIIDILCLIILTIIDIKQIYDEQEGNITLPIIYLFIKIITEVLYSFDNVLAKILFLYYYLSPYTLLLYKAIIHIVYLFIFSFPFFFIEFRDEKGDLYNIFSMIGNVFDNKINILVFIGYAIISFFLIF